MYGIAASGFALLAMTLRPAVKAAEKGADTHNRRSARTGAYFEVRDRVGTST